MDLANFVDATGLLNRSEIDRARLLGFFKLRSEGVNAFTPSDIAAWFADLGLARPNVSRLKNRMRQGTAFVRAGGQDSFRLHAREVGALDLEFPQLQEPTEEIPTVPDTVIPAELYEGTRGYLERLARQINAAFEHNLHDACAVLMRRTIEILLIHSFEHNQIRAEIEHGDGFVNLNVIIDRAKASAVLGLTRETKSCLDTFRVLGNLSAHKIHYNARRSEIRGVLVDFRVAVEELLYKSGILN